MTDRYHVVRTSTEEAIQQLRDLVGHDPLPVTFEAVSPEMDPPRPDDQKVLRLMPSGPVATQIAGTVWPAPPGDTAKSRDAPGGGAAPTSAAGTGAPSALQPESATALAPMQAAFWAAATSDQAALARDYFQAEIDFRKSIHARPEWVFGVDLALLDMVLPSKREALAEAMVRKHQGLSRQQDILDLTEAEVAVEQLKLLRHRTSLGAQAVAAARESVQQMKRWTRLSRVAPVLLVVTLGLSVWGSVAAFKLEGGGHLNGPELALILFVLAVAALSPVALLLIERPLNGVDSFSLGTADATSNDKAASGSSSATSSSTKGSTSP